MCSAWRTRPCLPQASSQRKRKTCEKGRRLVRQEGGIAEGEAKIVRKQREGHFRRRGLSSTESRRLECHATYGRTAGLCTWSSEFSKISFTGSPTYAALTYTGTDTSGAGLGAVEASLDASHQGGLVHRGVSGAVLKYSLSVGYGILLPLAALVGTPTICSRTCREG
jgi:hypothetical protein